MSGLAGLRVFSDSMDLNRPKKHTHTQGKFLLGTFRISPSGILTDFLLLWTYTSPVHNPEASPSGDRHFLNSRAPVGVKLLSGVPGPSDSPAPVRFPAFPSPQRPRTERSLLTWRFCKYNMSGGRKSKA